MLTEQDARRYYEDNDASHSFEHVLRVLALAERIARAEGADQEVVRTAALLHDIGRGEEARTGACHAEAGARQAREILQGCPADFVEAVSVAIACHRFRRPDRRPQTPEARALYDADKLDAIGAIGVARAYAVAGRRGQQLCSPLHAADAGDLSQPAVAGAEAHTPVQEYLFKLRHLKDRLFTDAGRSLAADRHAFMVAFFERLEREVRGEI